MTRKHKQGFTLLELIIVIGIMGVAMSLGIMMLFEVTKSWNATTSLASLDANADKALRYIGLDLAETLSSVTGSSVKGVAQTVTNEQYFRIPLENDVLSIPVGVKQKGVTHRAEVVYSVDRTDVVGALVREAQTPGAATKVGSRLRVVPGVNVVSFRAEFLPKTPGGAWQAGWSDSTPPKAVRVTLTVSNPYKPQEQVLRKAVFPVEVN